MITLRNILMCVCHLFFVLRPNVTYSLLYNKSTPVDVKVISHEMQRYAVWFGGSMLASTVRKIYHLSFSLIIYSCYSYLKKLSFAWIIFHLFSPSSIVSATRKNNMKSLGHQSVAIIWHLDPSAELHSQFNKSQKMIANLTSLFYSNY